VKFATTSSGVAYLDGDHLVVLDTPYRDLGEVLDHGALGDLADAPVKERIPLADAELRAPVPRPPKVICIGINYGSHVDELRTVLGDFEAPSEPVFFFIPSSAVCGPDDPIVLPAVAPGQVDHECELAVVIGTGGHGIAAAEAWGHVAGLTMSNDVSARDVQSKAMRGQVFELSHAKGFDTFKPMGPFLLTTDEVDTGNLDIDVECSVNGTIHQQASTTDLVFDVAACIAHVSKFVSLAPGDVILTGSPAGVGFFQGRFLNEGDVVEVTGSGIGTLRNVCVAATSRSGS
jgi:2-keto-4-pentenoate hydratase/2-oxohepta-3-ene-1,7-dioic acid hydratase in catechol pathway